MPTARHRLVAIAWLLGAASLGPAGCFRIERQQLTQRVRVETQPPGASVWVQDSAGKQHVGASPLWLTRRHERITRRFNRWHWLWTAAAAAATGVGAAMIATDDSQEIISSGQKTGGIVLTSLGGTFALTSLLLNLVFESASGVGQSAPEQVMVGASRPGYADGWTRLTVPSDTRSLTVALVPGGSEGAPPTTRIAGVLGGLRGGPGGLGELRSIAPTERPIVAVFRIQDAGARFGAELLEQLTDYLAAQVTATSGFRTVPRQQLRSRLSAQRRASYRACYEEACQIEVGKALAAQLSLATRLLRVGPRCALTSVLYDLKSETAGAAASVETRCSAEALMAGIREIAAKLRAGR